MSDTHILLDHTGIEWVCLDISPRRSSYATYACRRRDQPESNPRVISVPRSWNLDDPAIAAAFLAR